MRAALAGKGPVIAQRFVAASRGRDVRAFVVGGKLMATMRRRLGQDAAPTEFRANIAAGAIGEPFDATPEIAALAEQAARVFNLDIAGVDLLFDETGFTICEVNMSPGLEGIEQITGVDLASAIMNMILRRIHLNAAA